MKMFFLLVLLSFPVLASEVCVSDGPVLSERALRNVTDLHALTCKTEITYDEYRSCMREPKWRGGVMTTQCDQGRYRGCCYRRWNGNPRSDWELIRCDEIDTRDPLTAFLDIFRRR